MVNHPNRGRLNLSPLEHPDNHGLHDDLRAAIPSTLTPLAFVYVHRPILPSSMLVKTKTGSMAIYEQGRLRMVDQTKARAALAALERTE